MLRRPSLMLQLLSQTRPSAFNHTNAIPMSTGIVAIILSIDKLMKRLATQPITAFFQRKQTRCNSIESVYSDDDSDKSFFAIDTQQLSDVNEPTEATGPEKQSKEVPSVKRNTVERRETFEHVTGILQRREIAGCVTTRHLMGGNQSRRHRRKQLLVRWALTHLQRLPIELHLSPYVEWQANAIRCSPFYTSCLEFDAEGVLLVAGASNGVIALYDFDDVIHRCLNLGQRMQTEETIGDLVYHGEKQEQNVLDVFLHPIHTISTPYELRCIRWNPLNENEIACSFTNRNEIYVFNLGKFPSKPHKILKSSNHPTSGYNDIVYLPRTASSIVNLKSKQASVIAGDIDGAIRLWDPRFPLKPVWSFLTASSKTPISSLLLSPNQQFLICGNEAGILMTYDILHKVVPAFGSKPVPQLRTALNIIEIIKPYLSPALIEAVLLTNRSGSPGITSLRLVSESETQVLCQLRNDWVVVVDYLLGTVVKFHTFLRGLIPREKSKRENASLSVPSTTTIENENQRDFLPRSLRNSWLAYHRCSGIFLFDESIMCTGLHDANNLSMVDLKQLRHIKAAAATSKTKDTNEVERSKSNIADIPIVERLDRFRIPMNSVVTAVATHPTQHFVICGGENMRLQIMDIMGK